MVGHLTKGSQEFEGFAQFWMPLTQTHSQIFVLVSIGFSGQSRNVLNKFKEGNLKIGLTICEEKL